jgi:hypothetical protein
MSLDVSWCCRMPCEQDVVVELHPKRQLFRQVRRAHIPVRSACLHRVLVVSALTFAFIFIRSLGLSPATTFRVLTQHCPTSRTCALFALSSDILDTSNGSIVHCQQTTWVQKCRLESSVDVADARPDA